VIISGVPALPYDDSAGFTAPPAFGTFRVLHQIGSGVLGPVFRTFEPQHEKLVAIKAFRLDVVPEVTARLADGLRRLAANPVSHPAIIPIVDAGLEGTTAYLASEYVAADTLDVALRHLAPARIEAALPLLRQVAAAIEAAWAAGVGHGSLHPRDIFVVAGGHGDAAGTTEVRVGGFGVVSALERLQIKAPVRRPYTAPERADGGAWDIRADVFSLGVIAHELLTGRRPAGPDEQDGELPTGTSPEQRVAIRRALASVLSADPARRFATPAAFVDALTTGEVPIVAERAETADAAVAEVPDVPEVAEVPAAHETVEPAGPVEPVAPAEPVEPVEPAEPEDVEHVMSGAPLHLPPSYEPPLYRGAIPAPPPTPAGAVMAGMLVLGVLLGTGVGYWLRGPAEGADVEAPLPLTEVITDEPIGTEVAVAQPPVPTPPPSGARAAAAPARGRLLVRTVPAGATVSVNGRPRGTSPATIRDLPFGTYNVTVSRAGYRRRVQRVTVSQAVPARDVTIELVRTAPAAAATATGSIYVETRPAGASVSIDGRALGSAPLLVPDLAPGPHTVRLDLAGHKSVTTTVVVRAGQRTPVRASLEIQ
jgi:serine/threonine-protein kinase